jgi:hypothetical protein
MSENLGFRFIQDVVNEDMIASNLQKAEPIGQISGTF